MSTALMAKRKNRNTKGAAIAQAILEQYQPQTKEEMQDAIKDIFGPMFEAMLQGEMDSHLGYDVQTALSSQCRCRRLLTQTKQLRF